MVEAWLVTLMQGYNRESYEQRAGYLAQVHMPGATSFSPSFGGPSKPFPTRFLVGIDVDAQRPHRPEVEGLFLG